MSNCSDCSTPLTRDNAYSRGNKENNRLYSYCKSCFNKRCIQRWKARKQKVIEDLGNRCLDCKQSFPICAYDLHHLEPNTKEFVWDKMRLISEEKLKNELSKCVLLCSNCHRIRHYALSN